MSIEKIIENGFTMRAKKMLSGFELAQMHQSRARELNVSLAKYYESNEGKDAMQQAIAADSFERTVATSNGDGYGGVQKVRDTRVEFKKVHEDKEPFALDAWEKFVKAMMIKYGVDKHLAYDHAMTTVEGQKLFASAMNASADSIGQERDNNTYGRGYTP